MGHWPARLVRALTYVALACGAALACMLLSSSPAQADDAGSPLPVAEDARSEADGAGGSAGRLAGEAGRDSTGQSTDLVRDVAAVAPEAEPTAGSTTQVVDRTADEVATEAEQVTAQVDTAVEQAVESVPVEPPTPEPPVEEPTAEQPAVDAPSSERSQKARARESRADAPRRPDPERSAGRDRRDDATASLIRAVGAQPQDSMAADPGVVAEDPGADEDGAAWDIPSPCGHCVAGSSGSSVDGPTLHGLIGSGLPVARGHAATGIDPPDLGPAVTFSSPDVSPD